MGTLFLFLLLLLSCGVGIFHLVRLKNDAQEILKDNYESLEYCHHMWQSMDDPAMFDSLLMLQEANITEPGEREATAAVREAFKNGDTPAVSQRLQKIIALNMDAIEVKNIQAGKTANTALTYITLLAALIFLVGLTFSYNFPAVLTAPIAALTAGIHAISGKNYAYRIHISSRDEFGQMADAFNAMAARLEYFENSNLNKILFEKARAETVINSLKEASIGFDGQGIILFANGQALQLLGLSANEVVGRPVSEVSARNDLLRFLLEEKGTLPFKTVVDNRENYFTKEIMDIGDGNKVIVLRNITSFKELDVAKTNFIATISHELKTPLASSDLSLRLLTDQRVGQLSDEQKELLDQLKQDNQRMLRILSELLNMSQLEAGKIQLEVAPVAAGHIADRAVNGAQAAAREKHVSLRRQYTADAGLVLADAEKTGWVLNNFLSNAIRYSSENGEILIEISRSGNSVTFSVSDSGPGIAPEYASRIFERFFRIPGSQHGTAGLGLAISKEFIEAQGGQIWVKSEIGAGSTFGFSLPVPL